MYKVNIVTTLWYLYKNVVHTQMLAFTLKDDTTDNKQTEKDRQNANASAKSKELHPHTQSQPNAAHLLLPQPLTKPDKE